MSVTGTRIKTKRYLVMRSMRIKDHMSANQMEAQIKAGILKALLDATKDVCTNVNVRCIATGMQLQSIDSCHVAICALVLHEAAFSKYECAGPASLGLSFESLALTLKGCTAEEEVWIAWDRDSSDRLTISRGDSREYQLKLLDLDCCEDMDIPEQTYEASLTLRSDELLRICRDLGTMGDTVAICVDKQKVRFSVEGDVGKGAAIVSAGEHVTIEAPSGEMAPLHYPMKYIVTFAKAAPLSHTVVLKLGTDTPLHVGYLVEGAAEKGHLHFYLAPRIV